MCCFCNLQDDCQSQRRFCSAVTGRILLALTRFHCLRHFMAGLRRAMPTSPDALAGNSKLGHDSPALPDPASALASAAAAGLQAKRQTLSALIASGSAAATVPVSWRVHGFREQAVPTAAVPDLGACWLSEKTLAISRQFGLGVACAAVGVCFCLGTTTLQKMTRRATCFPAY